MKTGAVIFGVIALAGLGTGGYFLYKKYGAASTAPTGSLVSAGTDPGTGAQIFIDQAGKLFDAAGNLVDAAKAAAANLNTSTGAAQASYEGKALRVPSGKVYIIQNGIARYTVNSAAIKKVLNSDNISNLRNSGLLFDVDQKVIDAYPKGSDLSGLKGLGSVTGVYKLN